MGVEGSLPAAFRVQRLVRAQRQPVVCRPQVARPCSGPLLETLRQQRAVLPLLEMQDRHLAWQRLFRRPSEPPLRKTSLHPSAKPCLPAEKEPAAGRSRRVRQPIFLAKGFATDRPETSAEAPAQAELLERMAQLFSLGQSAAVFPDRACLRQACLSQLFSLPLALAQPQYLAAPRRAARDLRRASTPRGFGDCDRHSTAEPTGLSKRKQNGGVRRVPPKDPHRPKELRRLLPKDRVPATGQRTCVARVNRFPNIQTDRETQQPSLHL